MNKYLVYLIVGGFGAWVYNEYIKQNSSQKPKLK